MRCVSTLAALIAVGCTPAAFCSDPGPGEVCRVAGTGNTGFNRDGLPPADTDFYLPSAVRPGPDGRLYVMDFNNQRIRVLDGDVVTTVVGNGFHAPADPSLPAPDSPLENPIDFSFLPDGRLVFVSYHDPRVIVASGERLEVLAGTGEVGRRGNEGDFEDPSFAQFIQLDGIAVDGETVYVSDSLANRVRAIRNDIIETVAGRGSEGFSGDGGSGLDAELHWPTALELDRQGGLLIADSLNHAIRRLAPDGTLSTIAGTGIPGFSGDGGQATLAQLNQPNGLGVAEDGTIYVADRGNFRIRRIGPDGIIETVAGVGTEGFSGDGGSALEAQFGFVARIAMGRDGASLLVADQSNGCARRVMLR